MAQLVKNPPAMQETWVQSLGWENPLEKVKKGYPLQHSCLENSMDCKVHGVAKPQLSTTSLVAQMVASLYNVGDLGSILGSGRFPGEGNGKPLQYSCLENPMDGGI